MIIFDDLSSVTIKGKSSKNSTVKISFVLQSQTPRSFNESYVQTNTISSETVAIKLVSTQTLIIEIGLP